MIDGIQLRVTEDTISEGLAGVRRVAGDPSTIMSAIAAYMVASSQRHIETETGPDGKWPRLSPRTAARRIGRRRRGTENILRVSNRLYSSMVGDSGADFAAVGTNVLYAAIQHEGGTVKQPAREQDINLSTGRGSRRFVRASAKRKETRRVTVGAHEITIPARPWLYLDAQDVEEILDIAEEGIMQP